MYTVVRCLLGDRLRSAGITQQQLADLTGYPKSSISAWVHDVRLIPIDRAHNIAIILGCSIDELYEWQSVKGGRDF